MFSFLENFGNVESVDNDNKTFPDKLNLFTRPTTSQFSTNDQTPFILNLIFVAILDDS